MSSRLHRVRWAKLGRLAWPASAALALLLFSLLAAWYRGGARIIGGHRQHTSAAAQLPTSFSAPSVDTSHNASGVFSLADVVDMVGTEPRALLGFFNDAIARRGYRGALRDARSVLITRAANSLDGSRFLAALLSSAGHRARVVTLGARPESTSSYIHPTAADLPAFLEGVATSTLHDVMALGDKLYAEGLIGDDAGERERGSRDSEALYGVQIWEEDDWRFIHGQALPDQPVRPIDLAGTGAGTIEFSVDVVYESDDGSALRNVLRVERDLAEIAFAPVWLDFHVDRDSANPVLHLAASAFEGSKFPVNPQVSDQGLAGGTAAAFSEMASAIDGIPGEIAGSRRRSDPRSTETPSQRPARIRDIRLAITAMGNPAFPRRQAQSVQQSFSLSPPSGTADTSTLEGKIINSIHGISVVTGTPVHDYLLSSTRFGDAVGRAPEEARTLNAFNLIYFALRDLLPASPNNTRAYRSVDGPNVLTTSLYPADRSEPGIEIVSNLAETNYQLVSPGDDITFADRMWNGVLDHNLETFLLELIDSDLTRVSEPRHPQSPIRLVTDTTAEPPFELSAAQLARLDRSLTDGMVLAYSKPDTSAATGAMWWEIGIDGSTQAWNRWDRHQGLLQVVEKTIKTGVALRVARGVRVLGCAAYMALAVSSNVLETVSVVDPGVQTLADILSGLESASKDAVELACKNRAVGKRIATAVRISSGKRGAFRRASQVYRRKPWVKGGRVFFPPGR